MGIKIKNLQTGEFEKFNIPALKGEKGEPGEIEPSEKVDYIGKQHSKLRDTMNANVDYIIKTAIGEFNYLDYEGQHITATNSIEGHARSAILSGQTLVNLFPIDKIRKSLPSGWVESSAGVFEYTSSSTQRDSVTGDITLAQPLIAGKTYILKHDSDNTTDCASIGFVFPNETTGSWYQGVAVNSGKFGTTPKIITYTPKVDIKTVRMGRWNNDYVQNTTVNIKYPMILEYQQGMENWDIPYFEGMQSVKMPVLTTTGFNMVNPTDIEVIGCNSYDVDSDGIANIVGDTTGYWARSYIRYTHHLKANTTYYIYCDGDSTGTIKAEGWVDNNNSGRISWNNFYKYTPETDVLYEAKIFLNTDASPFTCSKIRIGIFESTTKPSSFEPYKSNILTVNEDVELRGIGDVKDTLDCLTGEVTERVGEYQITGEENWQFESSRRRLQILRPTFLPNIKCGAFASDILEAKQGNDGSLHGTNGTYYIGYTSDNWIRVILGEDLSSLEQGIEWLKANKPTIQYQLKTESIKTVDLSDNHVYSYKDVTHYDCSSAEGSLVPTLSVKVPTDTQLTIQEQKATAQTLLIKNMDLQQSIKEVQAMNLAFNTALYNSFNSIREEVEDIKKHVSTNENLEGSF